MSANTMLANTKRPLKFEDYVGHTSVTAYIKNVVAKGLHPNSIVISGAPGTGKSTLANLYARSTLCLERKEGSHQGCGNCAVCLNEDNDNISHYVVASADEAKEAFLDLIKISQSQPHSNTSREDQFRRFIIIDECQNASRQTMSLLLDPIEFCPPTTTWILISMDMDRLDPVVREAIESRSSELKLSPLSIEDIKKSLIDSDLDAASAYTIAHLSKGNFRKAWSIVQFFRDSELEISRESILVNKLGGATDEKREEMWRSLKAGNVKRVAKLINDWCSKSDEDLIMNLLVEDLFNSTETSEDNIVLLNSIFKWAYTNKSIPLSLALIGHAGSGISWKIEQDFDLEELVIIKDKKESVFRAAKNFKDIKCYM